nr:PKD domain-containing protein [Flavobacterium nitratireducens]
MKPLVSIFFVLISIVSYSQKKIKDTITRRATINYSQNGNTVLFKPETPPLIPIAGAPKPSFSYLWEFGDGTYSKAAEPKHTYKNKGTYNTRLTVTNNYDNGKPPATRPKKVVVNDLPDKNFDEIASVADQNGFVLQKNCDPIPDQEMEVILSYQNLENYVSSGKIYLFYNEKQYKDNNFVLSDFRTYAGEREIKENTFASITDTDQSNTFVASNSNLPIKKYENTTTEEDLEASLADAHITFKNVSILEFDDANPQETRNVFTPLKPLQKCLKTPAQPSLCVVFMFLIVVIKIIK